jgi:hypothetical protein
MTASLETIELVERSIAFISGSGITSGQLAELQTGYRFTLAPSLSSATVGSTTSRTTWADAMYYQFTLPSGTWTVAAQGHVELVNTGTGPSADTRIMIDGNGGTTFGRTVGGPTQIRIARPTHSRTGRSGTLSVRIQYKKSSGSTGTLRAYNPGLIITCTRTS